jgi:hypothetical protein
MVHLLLFITLIVLLFFCHVARRTPGTHCLCGSKTTSTGPTYWQMWIYNHSLGPLRLRAHTPHYTPVGREVRDVHTAGCTYDLPVFSSWPRLPTMAYLAWMGLLPLLRSIDNVLRPTASTSPVARWLSRYRTWPFSLGLPLEGGIVTRILDHDGWKNMLE